MTDQHKIPVGDDGAAYSGWVGAPVPGQEGQILAPAPIADPVRVAALQAAVEWARWAADGTLDPSQVLEAADRFAEWLVGADQAEQIPVDPHRFFNRHSTSDTAPCLFEIGPDRFCGRRRDDPVHQGEAP